MKVSYLEEIESKTAFSRKMYCPKCGSHCYCIHHQLEPLDVECWWIECEECKHEGAGAPTKGIAITRWQQDHGGK